MGKENYSPLNDIPAMEWRKYKFTEKRFKKSDNKLFKIATEGHNQELKKMFEVVVKCTTISEHDRRLAHNIWERYDITGELSFSDLQIIDGLYSKIISEQCVAVINSIETDNSLENVISLEAENEGR